MMAGCIVSLKLSWSVSSSWRPKVRTGDHMGRRSPKPLFFAWFLLAVALANPHPAAAWGDEGHKIIALIAERYLDPAVGSKVTALLATDNDPLTGHDIASEVT